MLNQRISKSSRAIRQWFLALSAREKWLVGGAAAVALIYLAVIPIQAIQESYDRTRAQIEVRTKDLSNLGSLLRRYSYLKGKIQSIESSYERSQMTFEQVSNELDRVVKESIGSDNYELKRGANTRPLGERLVQQEFSLRISSVTLEQLVKLIYQLENGKSALFLNRMDLIKDSGKNGGLSVTLQIATVAERRDRADTTT